MIKHTCVSGFGDVYAFNTDKFKSESLSIYFKASPEKKRSVESSLVLSMLRRGSKSYPSQKLLNKKLDELYATILAPKNRNLSSVRLIGFNADVIGYDYTVGGEDFLPRVAELMLEMLFSPALDENGLFNKEYFESEKNSYKDIILSQINDPTSYAGLRCREEMLSPLDESYKISELCSVIDSVSLEELSRYYENDIRNSEMVAFYTGKRDIDEIADIIEKYLPSRNYIQKQTVNEKKKLLNKEKPNYIYEKRESNQARIAIGINANSNWFDSDVYSAMLCNEILGVSPISKLMVNIREKMGLCYDCSSAYDMTRGVIFISSGIDSENLEKAKSEIFNQIEELKRGNVSESELIAGKKSIKRVYSSVFDSPASIERIFLGRTLLGINSDIKNITEAVEKLTAEDVAASAKKFSVDTFYFLDGAGGEELSYEE